MKEHASQLHHPLAIAFCKKLMQEESYYSWALQAGQARLFSQIKTIYQEFFHQRGGRVPRLALIAGEERIGLLLVCPLEEDGGENPQTGNMLSLYVEFDGSEAASVLQATAALLCAYDDNESYPEYFQRFLDYHSKLPLTFQDEALTTLPAIELPICCEPIECEHHFLSTEVALPSIRHNLRRCACYLREVAGTGNFPSSLILISAGRVTYESLQQFADKHSSGQLIVLTLSATVQEEIDLRSTSERYIPDTIRERVFLRVKKFFSKS